MNTLKKIKLASAFFGVMLAIGSHSMAQVITGGVPNASNNNLQLWLKADAGVTNSGNGTDATSWQNQATGSAAVGNATARAGTGNAPIFNSSVSGLNNQASLSFNGLSQGFTVANASTLMTGLNMTIFVVAIDAGFSGASGQVHMLVQNNANIFDLQSLGTSTTVGTLAFQQGGGSFNTIRSGTTTLKDQARVYSLERSGTGANQTQLFLNGVENDNGAAVGALPNGNNASVGYQTTFGDQRYFNGYISEILIYNSSLSQSDFLAVTGYLGNKYGIAAVPEPTTWALVTCGGLFSVIFSRRRSSRRLA